MPSASGNALASSCPYRSAMQPTATTARVVPCPLSELASSKASIESFLADSINPQVFTTATSASSTSETSVHPSAASLPASSSESTSLRAQPIVTIATVRLIAQILQGQSELLSSKGLAYLLITLSKRGKFLPIKC